MAHSFGNTILARTSAATSPITRSATTAAGDTVLVLMINTQGGTDRAGGAPTFNGVAGVQANSTQKAAASPEAGAELWYWTGAVPSGAGSLFIGTANIVIPNTGSLTIFSSAHTGRAATGFTSQFDAAGGANNTAANPATSAIVSTGNGAIYFATTAGGWQAFSPSARTGTSLYETDDGAFGGGGQYLLQTTAGSQAMGWTFGTSDDWGAVGAAFKEVPAPKPGVGALTIAGTVTALALKVGLTFAALTLAGPAPTVSIATGPVIQVPAGALQFKGPGTGSPASPTIAIPTGALTLSGPAPNVATSGGVTIPIPVGTLRFKGPLQGASIVSPAPSALTLTGQALTLGRVYNIAVPQGALTLTGQLPAVSSGATTIAIPAGSLRFKGPQRLPLQIPAGSLTLTGQSLNLGGSLNLPVPVGALTLTGRTPTLSIGSPGATLSPAPAALTFTGKYVAIGFGPDSNPGALVLTGQSVTPVIVAPAIFTPSVAALTFTGLPLVVRSVMPVGAGALVFAGPAPTVGIVTGLGIPIGAGALTLTGRTPTVVIGANVPVPVGALTLTGQSPALGLGLSLPVGALTLTGQVPSLSVNVSTTPVAGVLTLTGQSITVGNGRVISPASGALVLAGPAPTASVNLLVSVPVGALTLTGQTLTPLGAGAVSPFPAGLLLTGQAPALKLTLSATIAQASLILAGPAPALQLTQATAIAPASLTLAGPAPVALVARTALPATGALIITGPAPVVVVAQPVQLGTGTLTLAGTVPVLLVDVTGVRSPAPAALTLAGPAPTVVATGFQSAFVTLQGVYVTDVTLHGVNLTSVTLHGRVG